MARTHSDPLRSSPILAIALVGALVVGSAACERAGEAELSGDDLVDVEVAADTEEDHPAETNGARRPDTERRSWLGALLDREPRRVELPAGTALEVEVLDTLSSHATEPGSAFAARVTSAIRSGEAIAVPAGATIAGVVTEARPPRGVGGRARLALDFQELRTEAGSVPITATLTRVGKSQAGKDAAIIGGSTVGGAILGEAIDDGDGDLIGAIVGGLAGTAAAAKTKGKPVVLEAGTPLVIELQASVTVEVAE
jgi:hypothetical protein